MFSPNDFWLTPTEMNIFWSEQLLYLDFSCWVCVTDVVSEDSVRSPLYNLYECDIICGTSMMDHHNKLEFQLRKHVFRDDYSLNDR